jgi:tetratricopeptide (TPR) repeat protein
MQNRFFIILLIFASSFEAKEVSAFGAGDILLSTPYGLTSTEKFVLKNKNKLDKFDINVKGVKNSLNMLSERIDGIEYVIESDSKKLHTTFNNLNELSNKYDLNLQRFDESEKNIKIIIEHLLEEQSIILQNQNNFKNEIDRLTKLINTINTTYVSDNELKSNMSQFITRNEFNKLITLLDKRQSKLKIEKSTKTKKEMAYKASNFFKNQKYSQAIPLYEELLKLKYKPAELNYMLGKIWYLKKQYNKALSYFRTSSELFDKGWWMPTLLLNSAISFEKIGDIDNASLFYSTLLEVYPDTNQAKQAQKNIAKQKEIK